MAHAGPESSSQSSHVDRRVVLLVYGIVVWLLVAAWWYRPDYWLEYLDAESLVPRYRTAITMVQVGLVLLAGTLFLLRKQIYEDPRRLILSVMTLGVLILIGEGFARAYVCTVASDRTRGRALAFGQCGILSQMSPHHYLNWSGTPGFETRDGLNAHNSWGFRGSEFTIPKPAGVYRIAALGGSTTYTTKVRDWRNDYPRLLQGELRERYGTDKIEVLNFGIAGWTSWQSLINLEINVLEVEPDLIVVYHGHNDLGARLTHPDYYRSDNSGSRRTWEARDVPWPLHLTLVRWITKINPLSRLQHFVRAPTSASATEETGFISRIGGTALEALDANPPIYFERNLRLIATVAREFGADVLFVTWAYSDESGGRLTTPHYERGLEEMRESVKKVGRASSVPVYDFATEMPKDPKYWADPVHLNLAGARIKAKLFADYIEKSGLMREKMAALASVESK